MNLKKNHEKDKTKNGINPCSQETRERININYFKKDKMTNNKLIAEFMELEVDNGLYCYTTAMDDYKTDTLYFHSSWDWLMPVANEIIKSRDEQNADWDLTDLKYALCTTNIEWVYKAVVNFIKRTKKST